MGLFIPSWALPPSRSTVVCEFSQCMSSGIVPGKLCGTKKKDLISTQLSAWNWAHSLQTIFHTAGKMYFFLMRIWLNALIWVLPKSDPKTRVDGHVDFSEGNPRKYNEGIRPCKQEGMKACKWCINGEFTSVGK